MVSLVLGSLYNKLFKSPPTETPAKRVVPTEESPPTETPAKMVVPTEEDNGVVRQLIEARRLIEIRWVQGISYREDGGQPGYCVVGAMDACCYLQSYHIAATKIFCEANSIAYKGNKFNLITQIPRWNDAFWRTKSL